jgi:hypothetical protein
MMSQEFQESLLKETPSLVSPHQQNKHDNVFTNFVRKNSRRDLSKSDFTSVWSTNATSSQHEASRKNVASAILMRRAPSIVFEDVGIVSDQLWSTALPPPSPKLSATNRSMIGSTAESTLNSLECWDYSVELECLSGPDGKFLLRYLTLI